MSTHNIGLHEEMRKFFTWYHFLSGAMAATNMTEISLMTCDV